MHFISVLCLTFIVVGVVWGVKQGSYEVVPMSGAYFEEQEVDLYDDTAVILFELPKPDWLDQFPFFLGYPCNSDKYQESTLCPIFYYLSKQLRKQLESALEISGSSLPVADIEVNPGPLCDEINRHFPTPSLKGYRLEEYVERLGRCTNFRLVTKSLGISSQVSFRSPYDKMMARFMEEYHNRLPTANRENKAAELNARLGLTSIIVGHLLALKDQWSSALSECSSGFIPEALVTSEALRAQLIALEATLGSNFKFSLPHSGTHISRYYKVPLADCVTTEDKLMIRIQVPIVIKRITPATLIKIKSVPFHTQTDEHQLCMMRGFEKGRYFNLGVQKTGSIVSSLAMEMNCRFQQLCKIPSPLDNVVDSVTDCARALITHEFEASDENQMNIVSACKLDCVRFETDKFPVTVRSKNALGTVYVMMNPDNAEDLFMECEKKDDSLALKPPVTGVLGLTIPCRCKIVLATRTLLPDLATCKDFYIANAIPYHWEGQNTLAK